MTSSTVSSERVDRQVCTLLKFQKTSQPKSQKQIKKDHDQERGTRDHSDIPEWLQEFRENLVDDRVP